MMIFYDCDKLNIVGGICEGSYHSGKLTADQVRKAIFNGSSYASYDGAKYYADGIGMQAIADELNATLSGGECETCRHEVRDNLAETDGYGDVWLECTACHWQMPLEPTTPRFDYCPSCGRKVVR